MSDLPPAVAPDYVIADFARNIAQRNSGAIVQIGEFMQTQSPAFRARFIERCLSRFGSVADLDAGIH